VNGLATLLPEISRERVRRGLARESELSKQLADITKTVDLVHRNPDSDSPFWKRTYRFWHQMFFSGVDDLWRATSKPVLVLHGENDLESVPVSAVRAAQVEFAAARKNNVEFRFYPNRGHDLLAADVFRDVGSWIATRPTAGLQSPKPHP